MVLYPLLQSALLAIFFQTGVQVPPPVGLVNDFAHVIPSDRVQLIGQIAQDVRSKSKGEIAIVTFPDIGQRAVSDVALQIGREWKVGGAGKPGDPTRNAGAVVLIVPKETSSDGHGHCWISTGKGAEGFITDADAGDICREATPLFQRRDYGAAITLITYRVAERFAQEFSFTLDTAIREPQPVSRAPAGRGIPPQLIFLGIVFLVLLLSGRRGGRTGCLPLFIPFGGGFGGRGGGGGGGFGGFGGGGGFSGGGGGSDW